MAKEFKRNTRVGQQLQKEVSNILEFEVSDSRLGMTTVSDVDLSPDLKSARVYVTFFGDLTQEEIDSRIEILNNMVNFIRRCLAKNMVLRVVPRLNFKYDKSLVDGIAMSNLISSVINK
ncbi:MAG: 30S ribosome-binding factor RbfA [Psittacicella sp.]